MATQPRSIAIYPGTFDPLTNGHAGIIRRGRHIFDEVVVAVAADTPKTPLFSLEERVCMARAVFAEDNGVRVEAFSGLLVEYAARRGARVILRGLRAVSDYEYEFQTSLMNRKLQRGIETIFLISDYRWLYISSTIVKTVASLGGDVKGLVPDEVLFRLRERYGPPHPQVVLPDHLQNLACDDLAHENRGYLAHDGHDDALPAD